MLGWISTWKRSASPINKQATHANAYMSITHLIASFQAVQSAITSTETIAHSMMEPKDLGTIYDYSDLEEALRQRENQ